MTAQIGDRFNLVGRKGEIVKANLMQEFHPLWYGIEPEGVCTACWRGYWCVYSVGENGIFLEDLYVNAKNGQYPQIAGVTPVAAPEGRFAFIYMGHHLYKGLNIKCVCDGQILVGEGLLSKYCNGHGTTKPWAYETLTELVFQDGILVGESDQSHVGAEIRRRIDEDMSFEYKMFWSHFKGLENGFDLDPEIDVWWV